LRLPSNGRCRVQLAAEGNLLQHQFTKVEQGGSIAVSDVLQPHIAG